MHNWCKHFRNGAHHSIMDMPRPGQAYHIIVDESIAEVNDMVMNSRCITTYNIVAATGFNKCSVQTKPFCPNSINSGMSVQHGC